MEEFEAMSRSDPSLKRDHYRTPPVPPSRAGWHGVALESQPNAAQAPASSSASIDRYGTSKSSEENESNPRRFQFLSDEPVPPVLDGTLLELKKGRR